jgi:hypothetical protein
MQSRSRGCNRSALGLQGLSSQVKKGQRGMWKLGRPEVSIKTLIACCSPVAHLSVVAAAGLVQMLATDTVDRFTNRHPQRNIT